MTYDPVESGTFGIWLEEMYRWDPPLSITGEDAVPVGWPRINAAAPPVLRCRRCDLEVTWPTKHAHDRHGDDVVVTLAKGNTEEGTKW